MYLLFHHRSPPLLPRSRPLYFFSMISRAYSISRSTIFSLPSKPNTRYAPESMSMPKTFWTCVRVSVSLYRRTAHGRRRLRMRSAPALMAVWKSLKRYARNLRASGIGWILSVTFVMTPSVPSLPRNIIVRSGPDAWRGIGRVLMISPVGVTTSRLMTMSSILPHLVESTPVPRWARNPPMVAQAMEAGRCMVE